MGAFALDSGMKISVSMVKPMAAGIAILIFLIIYTTKFGINQTLFNMRINITFIDYIPKYP
jgi:hypothetical protein